MATALDLGTPPVDPIDLTRVQLWQDESFAPLFARLRADDPVHFCPDSGFGPYWSVTRYRDIVQVESLPDIYSSSWEYGGITVLGEGPSQLEGADPLPMFIAMDRPQHTAQRRTVSPAFTPSEMDRLSVEIRARTAALLDELPRGEAFDWVDRVSIELTTGMLAILFDFPWADRRLLTYWSDWMGDIEAARDPELGPRRMEVIYEAGAYFNRLREERQAAAPAPDLLSMMLHGEATRDMTPQEYLGNVILLIVGGNDTTRNSMSGLAMTATDYRGEWAKVVADPALVPTAAQELIRWQTPLAHMRRTTTQATELGGKTIPAGSKVVMWYMSGNRDEELFPDGDRFVADRPNARRHLAFGYGIHRCVGARLAELQLGILIEELLKRRVLPAVVEPPERVPSSFVHGYRRMMVEMRPI
jgi:cytochrome P450